MKIHRVKKNENCNFVIFENSQGEKKRRKNCNFVNFLILQGKKKGKNSGDQVLGSVYILNPDGPVFINRHAQERSCLYKVWGPFRACF